MVVKSLGQPQNGIIVDVGCGQGNLFKYVENKCDRYIGVDVV
jgi:ubiquinone/menaquinone biosynthesis C-methylase UbiE